MIFIYFAALSGAIAFGGLTNTKSEGLIGIPETLITSCVAGCLFALFAGNPMIITGLVTDTIFLTQMCFFTKDGVPEPVTPHGGFCEFYLRITKAKVGASQALDKGIAGRKGRKPCHPHEKSIVIWPPSKLKKDCLTGNTIELL